MSALVHVRQSFEQLPPTRRVQLGGVVVGAVVLLLLVARWATQTDYALLFGNLAASDAGEIAERLEADGVDYELRDGGASIYVPRDEVYGLRVSMATSGLVTDGPAGYELFDGGTLGMTDFMQRMNLKRALEGELARTITAIRQVERARVHLVIPERSPFQEDQASATASVVLAVRGDLGGEQTAGVAALVAGAVEGMDPSDVTVLDEAGRMLAGPGTTTDDGAGSTAQVRLRREMESHLADAGQTMLDQLLGPGRAVVRVAADLDLSSTVTERNAVDPESQTLISEERQQEAGQGVGAESSVRNFELTREITRAQREAGAIRSLTVSVLLDEAAPPTPGTAGDDADDDEPAPFTDEQLRQIESLVKNAVGYDEGRGDQFAVQQLRFASTADAEAGLLAGVDGLSLASGAFRYAIVLIALLLGYRLLRRLADGLSEPAEAPDALPGDAAAGALADGTAPADGAAPALADGARPDGLAVGPDGELLGLPEGEATTTIDAVEGDPFADKLAPDADLRDAAALLADVRDAVDADPVAAAAVVRAWLLEDAAV